MQSKNREKEMKTRESSPATPSRNQHPLYLELVSIGRRERSIRPNALLGYKHLLNCEEVSRRALGITDPQLRAQHASLALHDAIRILTSKLTREMAEVALCAAPEFEGLQVTERLHKLPGITENIFKYRRRLAFQAIIMYLTTPSSTEHLGPQRGAPPSSSPARYIAHTSYPEYYEVLTRKAAAIHYAGLATLFAYDFDDELRLSEIRVGPLDTPIYWTLGSNGRSGPFWGPPLFPYTTLIDYLFEEYVRFAFDQIAYQYLTRPSKSVPSDGIHLLKDLWHEITDSSPARPSGITDEEAQTISATAPLGLQSDAIRRHYRTSWWPWCVGRGLFRDDSNPMLAKSRTKEDFVQAITPMTACSGAFVHIFESYINFESPIHSNARLKVRKVLTSRYDFDEWAPIMDGKPLVHRLDTYLDSEHAHLTDKGLAWHSN